MLRARPSQGQEGLAPLHAALRPHAPDHRLAWWQDRCEAETRPVVVFIDDGPGYGGVDLVTGPLDRGDVVLLRTGQVLEAPSMRGLAIALPPGTDLGSLPVVLRPNHDPSQVDRPGGCAEETRAYRRILLTWSLENGPHVLHALNCHRVEMTDSLSHYHRPEGGFDELYLVQGVQPGAAVWAGPAQPIVDEAPETAEQARRLLTRYDVEDGDLLHVPRGTVHRAVGGVLAQVITLPGFVPGAEIGVDHHLRRIAERFELGPSELPFRVESSSGPVVR